MKIGNVEVKNSVILAPMAGITDKTFRTICKEHGAGVVTTEMISAKGIYYKDKKTEQLMDIKPSNHPVIMQIFGSDPLIMAQVVKDKLNYLDTFDILDINMGCPAPKIVNNGDGSALMKTPRLAMEIVKRIKHVSSKPVTVKIRKGWDKNNINYMDFAKMLQESGADALTLHARTRDQFYSGKADWNAIAALKANLSIPVIGNGDIFSFSDARKMLDETQCDGIMIGRGALGNPWIFKQIMNGLKNQTSTDYPDYQEKLEQVMTHLDMLTHEKSERVAVLQIRKHCGWYIKGLHGAAEYRNRFNQVQNRDELKRVIYDFIQSLDKREESA
ncbi:MAG: tRNA dihydrouridine synthase B [Clostridiales bacterium 38_11]|nr:MAG: tRNA dihydrouridine synthase B [Clostridiales bacterium 38_11]HBH12594.1 tRNA dihydrouridine synthase DusB [Clostridiales bacterium]